MDQRRHHDPGHDPVQRRRQAPAPGRDPITEAALASATAWPRDSPCDLAAASYMETILAGRGQQEAARQTGAVLVKALASLAQGGAQGSGNRACLAAAQAYWTALPASEKTEPTYFKAFMALAEKLLGGRSPHHDPVCVASLEAGSDSFASEMTSRPLSSRAPELSLPSPRSTRHPPTPPVMPAPWSMSRSTVEIQLWAITRPPPTS